MPLKIVYLDDEPDLCAIFSESFSNDQVQITTFTDPDKCVQFVKSNPPDLIFLDYRLPATTGDLVAVKMATQIPIILITGDVQVSTQYQFKKILPKPYDYGEIEKVIQSLKK